MSWRVPNELEDAVFAAAREVVGDAALAPAQLARSVADRSRRYTSERGQLAAPADARADLAARAAFFTIADAMKLAVPVGELVHRGALPVRTPLRVVDVGAGCGAMTLGLCAAIDPGRALEVTAIDRDERALRIASAAVKRYGGARVAFTARSADVATAAIPAADLIVLGTVLNELPPAAREPLVTRALAQLADDGALIIIEPALRETARALHELRDAMIARGAHVFAPCTRTVAPCPMLADADDWCHEDRPLALPPRTAELARVTHLRDDGMKFAYLVLRKNALPLVEPEGAAAWRVVSAPFSAKGKVELFGCSAEGRVRLRLLRRHRNTGNRELERAHRGDVLVIAPATTEVVAETSVERIEPAAGPRR